MIEGYTTVAEIAKKWGVKPRTVQIMCAEGRIAGVTKFGRAWAIPVDADNLVLSDWVSTGKTREDCIFGGKMESGPEDYVYI